MLFSQIYLPTLREKPAEAEVISHQLMMRAGMIRKLSSGVYSFLPLGVRSLRKMETIIREEMDRAGAQEVILPALQPAELWQESGRWDKYGKELFRLKDRHDHEYCLGPTHEEVITDLVRHEIRSYRQLPVNLYQIQTKFRDEIRPRFGLMRGREFGMKDGYSFDRDEAGAEDSYRQMFEAYSRIFARCGLKFKSVEADSGTIGGSFSHEFMVLADTGEDAILACSLCAYGANVERAVSHLPVVGNPEEELRPVRKVDTPGRKTVEEVTRFLDIPATRLVKTLIYQTPQGPVGILVRGDQEVNETKVRRVLDADEISLAEEALVEQVTGAPVGFAGAVGLTILLVAEETIRGMKNFVMGANEQDRHFVDLNWERDVPISRWADVREVQAGEGCPRCRSPLSAYRGIEVGHVFKLGDKYSRALKATFLDAQGQEQPLIMGCYGIGVGRTVAAAIEQNHDGDGIIWPLALAPFQVIITPTDVTAGSATFETARSLYDQYRAAGLEVLLDDRDERPGIKFKDADLIGIPLRITVGPKGLQENVVELRPRATKTVQRVPVPQSLEAVQAFITRELGKMS
ncbi:MAG: proline--tRNA ligase [Deltaproteobacteria bacterium]|nr:proline--tRNA ligase [Deltaproteobacteria bacterium]